MTKDLADAASEARSLAKELRNKRCFAEARSTLENMIDELEDALSIARQQKELHSKDACAILEQISLTYGTLGGTFRDERHFEDAIRCYDLGNECEQERRAFCNHLDSYNLLQRLVVRLLLEPGLLDSPDFIVELNAARSEIDRQVDRGRTDSWALADQALVRFLCGIDASDIEKKLKDREAERAFYESTQTVVRALIEEGLGSGTPLGERLAKFRNLLRLKGGLE